MRFKKKKYDQVKVATLMRNAEINPKLATTIVNKTHIANSQELRAEKCKDKKIEGQHFNILTHVV